MYPYDNGAVPYPGASVARLITLLPGGSGAFKASEDVQAAEAVLCWLTYSTLPPGASFSAGQPAAPLSPQHPPASAGQLPQHGAASQQDAVAQLQALQGHQDAGQVQNASGIILLLLQLLMQIFGPTPSTTQPARH